MRQLLESFAAEEGFHMDDDSSFSEGEEELDEEEQHKNTAKGESAHRPTETHSNVLSFISLENLILLSCNNGPYVKRLANTLNEGKYVDVFSL